MDAAMPHAHAEEHTHPTAGVYVRIGLVLFILTALEVGAFDVAHRQGMALGEMVKPILIPVLLILSAMKFALVAMFYMHLKPDSKIFSTLFVFPLLIAAVIIVMLLALFTYAHSLPNHLPLVKLY
jgi:caa(3)-type oxidase subunit IV